MSQHDSIRDRELPEEIAAQFAAVGLDRAPATVGEWLELTMEVLDHADVPTGLDALCTTDRHRHEATVDGETRSFHCVLDTLLLPFIVDAEEPVTVRSQSPESGEIVKIRVSCDDLEVTPRDAVMSFGIAADADVEGPPGDAIDPTAAYEMFCPFVNAFTSREEYDRWAEETEDAITIGLTMAEGHEIARALEESHSVPSDSH